MRIGGRAGENDFALPSGLEKVGLEVASEPPEYRAGDLFSVEI
jgi:hypothetical protein